MGHAIVVATLKARRIALMPRWAALKTNPASLESVAAVIGVSKPTLWRWEELKGKNPPPKPMMRAWRKALTDLEIL
jgi:transcriptional regulator with XRE-family HTH domain